MAYAVELYFDPATEATVRAIWSRLDELGIGDSLSRAGFVPHISLAVCPDVDADALYSAIGEWAAQRAPLPVSLGSAGVFAGERPVIFLAPVPSVPLLDTHAELFGLLARHSVEVSPHYHPGQWIPHCTLAQDLVNARVGEAIDIARSALPLSGQLVRVGISVFRPARVEYEFALAPPKG